MLCQQYYNDSPTHWCSVGWPLTLWHANSWLQQCMLLSFTSELWPQETMGYLGNGECYLMGARNLATKVRRLVYGASTTFSFFFIKASTSCLFILYVNEQQFWLVGHSCCLPLSLIGTSFSSHLTGLTGCLAGQVVPRSLPYKSPWTVKMRRKTMRGRHF